MSRPKCPQCSEAMSRDHELDVFYCDNGHPRVEEKSAPVGADVALTLDRPTLRGIRRTATVDCNERKSRLWKRAYLALADAANTIDAMMARMEDQE